MLETSHSCFLYCICFFTASLPKLLTLFFNSVLLSFYDSVFQNTFSNDLSSYLQSSYKLPSFFLEKSTHRCEFQTSHGAEGFEAE